MSDDPATGTQLMTFKVDDIFDDGKALVGRDSRDNCYACNPEWTRDHTQTPWVNIG